jgi:hypothetical protein
LCEFREFFLFLNIFAVQWIFWLSLDDLFDDCFRFSSFLLLLLVLLWFELEFESKCMKCIIFLTISRFSLELDVLEEFDVDLCLSLRQMWLSLQLLLWVRCGFFCRSCFWCWIIANVMLLLCCLPINFEELLALELLLELLFILTIGLFFGGDFE